MWLVSFSCGSRVAPGMSVGSTRVAEPMGRKSTAAPPAGGLATKHWSARTSLAYARTGTDAQGLTNVVLAGRATTVPFTGVPTGLGRTPTDNAKLAMTCAVRHPPR
jgi:hypothetical protein